MSAPAVSAVIFDWGGTLTPWHTIDARDSWISTVDDDELADRLLAAETEVWLRSRDEHRSATLAEVFAGAGITPTAAMLAAHSAWW
jgi:putative hydrolase of the HAD superfamily